MEEARSPPERLLGCLGQLKLPARPERKTIIEPLL
jgi:hypothetical protein